MVEAVGIRRVEAATASESVCVTSVNTPVQRRRCTREGVFRRETLFYPRRLSTIKMKKAGPVGPGVLSGCTCWGRVQFCWPGVVWEERDKIATCSGNRQSLLCRDDFFSTLTHTLTAFLRSDAEKAADDDVEVDWFSV